MRRFRLQALLQVAAAAVYSVSVFSPAGASAAPVEIASLPPADADVMAAVTTDAAVSSAAAARTEAAVPTEVAVATDAVMTEAALTTDAATTTAIATLPAENHLPQWLQVVVASAPLYSADSASDTVLAKLARHTFLRVVGGGSDRIQVQAYDDSGSPGQSGWVSADQVMPSAPGTDWLVSSEPTSLYDTSGGSARKLDRFTPLQKVDSAVIQGRLQVRVYRSDFSGVVDQGWVDTSATGSALPPQVRVPSPTDRTVGLRSPNSSGVQQAFLDMTAQAARQAAAQWHVPASVTVAQAILESDWGRSALAQDANNYFGMKAMGTLGNDGVVWMPTSEYDDSGELYQTTSAFRAYKSLADSMADHDELLEQATRYAPAMKVASDPKQFATQLAAAGYSTDPDYADKLVALMDRYNLYQLDT